MCSPQSSRSRSALYTAALYSFLIAVAGLFFHGASSAQTPTCPPDPAADQFVGVPILTGGATTPGGAVTYSNYGTIVSNGIGINVPGTTCGYSPSLLDRIRSIVNDGLNYSNNFTYVTTKVWKPDLSAGALESPVAGTLVDAEGNPLRDAQGNPLTSGSFVLRNTGTFQFIPGGFDALAAALQPGQSIRTSVVYQVTGTNSSGVSEDSVALLVVSARRLEDGSLEQLIGADFSRTACDRLGSSAPCRLVFGSSGRPQTDGTVFPDLEQYVGSLLQFSARGDAASAASVVNEGTISTSGTGAHGIYVRTQGATGSNGSDAWMFGNSSAGGAGGAGGPISVVANGSIVTCAETPGGCAGGNESSGVAAVSVGGSGGTGGAGAWWFSPKSGGAGAAGAQIDITGHARIVTGGLRSSGILALSQGGDGGTGGGGSAFWDGAFGAYGGAGGTVNVNGSWNITTWGLPSKWGCDPKSDATCPADDNDVPIGDMSHGIFAKSLGGVAGSGGGGGWLGTDAGGGGQGTQGGAVTVVSSGIIKTHGTASHGIYALSVGGYGGAGGTGGGIFYSSGGNGSAAGSGGAVSVTNRGWIETGASCSGIATDVACVGPASHGIFAQSIGGGGGSGGNSSWALVGFGGDSASGGDGGAVTVTNEGTIITRRINSRGIYAQSVGGGGGDGGDFSYGIFATGGKGSRTSNGGAVVVKNTGTITASGDAIFAQSIGGGGGNGGSTKGWFSFGGDGGAGGNASTVTVESHGNLTTSGINANAIFAESLGGGGGNGGNSVAGGLLTSVAIGGKGAAGGTGDDVRIGVEASSAESLTIAPVTGVLQTTGMNANGILAQSIGGGGGNGGVAESFAVGFDGAVSVALGGSGGGGNTAGDVSVYFGDSSSSIATKGANANGIFAQSLGGGGGSGGFSVAAAAAQAYAVTVSIGGSGGTGGGGGAVTVGSALRPLLGTITTEGAKAYGVFAQSVGGGGGSGGFAVAAGAAPSSLNFGLGGSAPQGATLKGGGNGSTVNVTSASSIGTWGSGSHALFAQSVGGGGGAGGFSVAAGIGAFSPNVSLGGNGGAGGDGETVNVTNSGRLITRGEVAHGLLAQSVGGGGGAGGFAISGSLTMLAAVDFALGGKGGTGGAGRAVTVHNVGGITTGYDEINAQITGKGSHGIFAQSVGGGGGAGGFGGAFSLQFNPTNYPAGALTIGVGGNGGGAGHAGAVTVINGGAVTTFASGSTGVFAQSVGGGGGDAGFGLDVTLSASAGKSVSLGFAMGGKGGSGGDGADVTVTNSSTIATLGTRSEGIFAQSVGGGGGNGGAAVSLAGALGSTGSTSASLALGGDGAGGGIGKKVTVTNEGAIETAGSDSIGILAQSIGGGGGNGGLAASLSVAGPPARTVSVAVGGTGGNGGSGGEVDVLGTSPSSIVTSGDRSHAIQAQSVGGGGGNGGSSTSLSLGVGNFSDTTVNVSAAVGGAAGTGNTGGAVNVGTTANPLRGGITTMGEDAIGILAQSIGGGGGSGGASVSGTLTGAPARSGTLVNVTLAVGGHGGSGNNGGAVQVHHDGSIDTWNAGSHGIEAQSIGGGGGNGGSARAVSLPLAPALNPIGKRGTTGSLMLSIGAIGGGGGDGNTVSVSNTGGITTRGGGAYGIFAQSIGGGGGSGGNGYRGAPGPVDDVLSVPFGKTQFAKSAALLVGGSAGAFGHASTVTVTNTGAITTYGDGSVGVLAQSTGGGGGVGGGGVGTGGDVEAGLKPGLFTLIAGGGGGGGGNGGTVNVQLDGSVTTWGDDASAVIAQSVGGGGGIAGGVERGKGFKDWKNIGWAPALGQDGGSGGNGKTVTVNSAASIFTRGDGSYGIFAQSVGGGGGSISGLGNDVGGILTPLEYLNFAGSVGGYGSGGAVTVNQSGSIVTLGEGADAIFAQSAGGRRCTATTGQPDDPCSHPGALVDYAGQAGPVGITLTSGNIFAAGARANAIVAQSRGEEGNDNISVSVLDSASVVLGGSDGGAAVRLLDGNQNTLTNHGTLGTTSGIAGTAIVATGGHDRVTNSGTVFGSVDLGEGVNDFTNEASGLLMAGDAVQLGPSGQLFNAGTLSPGGAGSLQTTAVTGSIAQAGSPAWVVDLGASGQSDTLVVSGAVQFGGTVTSVDLNGVRPFDAPGRYTLLSAPAGGVGGARFQFGTMLSPMPIGLTFGFVNSETTQDLTLSPSSGRFHWVGDPGAAWTSPFTDGSAVWKNDDGSYIYGTPGAATDVIYSRGGRNSLGADFAVNSVTFHGESAVVDGAHTLTLLAGNGTGVAVDGTATLGANVQLGRDQRWLNNGTLLVNGGVIGGAGTHLTIDGFGTTTITSPILTGDGSLMKTGTGTLVLAGSNNYQGGTYVFGGTLSGNTMSLRGNIRNEATLVFDQPDAGAYAGTLTGAGALIKRGDGALMLAGNSFGFGGTTSVETGHLYVNGVLGGSSVTVKPGALLGGSGFVTNTAVEQGGVLAPAGRLGVLGSLAFAPGAIYRVGTEAYGFSDIAAATGEVTVDGAVLDVQAVGSRRYRPINSYRIFDAPRGVTGAFSAVTTNLAYLNPSLQYGSNTVDLTLRRNDVDFTSVGTQGNQTSVALALNALVATATGRLASVVNTVYDLSDDEAQGALSSMSGVLHQFDSRAGLEVSRQITAAALRRLALVTREPEQALPNLGFGASAAGQQPLTLDARYGLWLSSFGGATRYRGGMADPAAKAPLPGVIAGFDRQVTSTLTLGVSGGRAWPEVTIGGRSDRSTSIVTHGGMYGRYGNGRTRFDAAFAVTHADQKSSRAITDGISTLTASSKSRSDGFTLQAEYGRAFDVGSRFTVEPVAGFQAGQLNLDGFVEQGGDVLALNVPSRTVRSQRSLLGGKLVRSIAAEGRMMIEGRAAWAHEFRALGDIRVRFDGDPFGSEFSVAAPNDERESAVLGLTFAAAPGAKVRLFADLAGEVGGPGKVWAGTVGLTRSW